MERLLQATIMTCFLHIARARLDVVEVDSNVTQIMHNPLRDMFSWACQTRLRVCVCDAASGGSEQVSSARRRIAPLLGRAQA